MTETLAGSGRRRGAVITGALAALLLLLVVLVPDWGPGGDPADPTDDPADGTPASTGERTVVTGRVTDAGGEPLAGVRVWGLSTTTVGLLPSATLAPDNLGAALRKRKLGPRTTTSADGTYRIKVPAGAKDLYRFAYEPAGSDHAWAFNGGTAHVLDAEAISPTAGEVRLDTVLPLAATVSGHVTGEWPRSQRARWTVAAVRVDGDVPRVVREVPLQSREWTLDGLAPGSYVVRAGVGGAAAVVEAAGEGLVADADVVDVAEGGRLTDVEVPLDHSGRVNGRVVDAEGAPVAGVDVHLVRTPGPDERGRTSQVVAVRRTDAEGRWATSADEGDYRVHLYAPPRSCFTVAGKPFHLDAGSVTPHEVTVEQRARIVGRVRWQGPMPYAGLSVRPTDSSVAPGCSAWLPDVGAKGGRFALTGLPAGTYRLDFVDPNGIALRAVRDRGAGPSPTRFSVRAGVDPDDFDLRLEPVTSAR